MLTSSHLVISVWQIICATLKVSSNAELKSCQYVSIRGTPCIVIHVLGWSLRIDFSQNAVGIGIVNSKRRRIRSDTDWLWHSLQFYYHPRV